MKFFLSCNKLDIMDYTKKTHKDLKELCKEQKIKG